MLAKINIRLYSAKMAALVAVVILTFSSCRKDFLERAPSDLIDEDKVFSNIDNAEAFLNNAYREVPTLVYRNKNDKSGYYNLGSATDEGAGMWGLDNTAVAFNSGNWNPVAFPLDWSWFAYYASIRKVNVFLKNYQRIPEEVSGQSTGSKKIRMLGEAHGLRAYYYFLLYTMWGEVPIIENPLKPGGTENINIPRSKISDVIAFIDQDLQAAIANLPATQNVSDFGRFTSATAKALLSRLYLYYASELSNPGHDQARWNKAMDASKEAIDFALANGYALCVTDNGGKRAYERVFLEMNNPETIWSSFGPYEGNGNYWDFWSGSLGTGGWYGESPLQEMVDSYEMLNGEIPVTGYDASGAQIINPAAGYDPDHPFDNRDPRFYQTILYHGATWKGRTVNVAPGGTDYSTDKPRVNYFWRKYIQEEHNLFSGSGFSQRRFIVFRVGELYLNYAEARNEATGPDAEVYTAINKIRSRAGMPALPAGLSQAAMREKIRHERKIELVLENQRFWDVRRWKIAERTDNGPVHRISVTTTGKFSYPVWTSRVFDKNKHYLFPIPQSEIDKNRQVLTQNPGW